MADDQVVDKTDVNSQVEGSAASTDASQKAATNPPTEENSGVEQRSENKIPQHRFNEVIQERNAERERREAIEARLLAMEGRLPGQSSGKDAEVERLTKKLGMSEEAARELASIVDARAQKQSGQVNAQLQAMKLAEWNRSMEQKYKDYQELVPDMEKVFSRLSPQAQMLAVSDPEGLEMLYHRTKYLKGGAMDNKAFDKGAQDAYQKKGEKQAVSSLPGQGSVSSKPEISAEYLKSIRGNVVEYKKNLERINHWLSTGKQI